ncbi:unnamed protein product [Linum trigynum]|uniref:Uncharacterized protein n=1 Tax=Linum trigynum TaxID=586398 RepID=A0AAV2DY15_9ROSI
MEQRKSFPKSFRFYEMWMQYETYNDLLTMIWSHPGQGYILQHVLNILKKLKTELKPLNHEEFSDISDRVKESDQTMKEKQVNALQNSFEESFEAKNKL